MDEAGLEGAREFANLAEAVLHAEDGADAGAEAAFFFMEGSGAPESGQLISIQHFSTGLTPTRACTGRRTDEAERTGDCRAAMREVGLCVKLVFAIDAALDFSGANRRHNRR